MKILTVSAILLLIFSGYFMYLYTTTISLNVDTDTVICLSKATRNISMCDMEIFKGQVNVITGCKQDYFFLIGITDGDRKLCNYIINDNNRAACIAVVEKQAGNIPSSVCDQKKSVCDYLANNNFEINDNFCEVAFNTENSQQMCKAFISNNQTLCYEETQ
jgi:hypothetical protein